MVSLLKPRKLVIRESKISYKSSEIHPLGRFVTEEAVCLKFKIKFEDIYVVECWRYVVYVHGKGLSKFVSYADFPPIIGVAPPTASEIAKWRRRWLKQHHFINRKQAPRWWARFFAIQFDKSIEEKFLHEWGKLIGLIKFAFHEEILQQLRNCYRHNKELLEVPS
ncbi:hypothetical protein Riv7116_0647 [Rivularia sp. PCC 7116]|uniref:hypothetical protein n=1 Tax=Rivularia sp. PCC 7116 TaxID=373994 RepID=UPI00029EEFFE|nr:hypothetical protein [Rivularia sp. PCC 7116]AFY53240.1 hypothetical protein Riv7116_0647 [Rivularia sp. PCC 7116]